MLKQIRILDEAGRLSLTNVGVLLTLCNMLAYHDLASVLAFGVAAAAYSGKRLIAIQEAKLVKPIAEIDELKSELAELKNRMSSLSMNAGLRPPVRPKY